KKEENPELEIFFITDCINTFYGTYTPPHIQALMDAGIEVVFTDLSKLRDSNPLYSGFYRSYFQWFGNSEDQWLKNALRPAGPEVNIRSYLELLNFKANHRKLIINEKNGLVTSEIEEHTSELQSRFDLVCRLLLEKKKKITR